MRLGYRDWSPVVDVYEFGGGSLAVMADGSLSVVVDDDYYNGVISPDDFARLLESAARVRLALKGGSQ